MRVSLSCVSNDLLSTEKFFYDPPMFQSVDKAQQAKSTLPKEHEQDLFVCNSVGPLAAKNAPQSLHVKNV